jgi:hypothetical protein
MNWKLPTLPPVRDLLGPGLPGFSFEESLRGSYWRLDAPTEERDIAFRVRASADDVGSFAKSRAWRLEGTISVDGVAGESDAEGTIALKLLDERRVLYRLTFRGDDGKAYELSGQKEWTGLAPLGSMTLLTASLYDEAGEEFARATLRFDLRADGLRLLRSFRVHGPWEG